MAGMMNFLRNEALLRGGKNEEKPRGGEKKFCELPVDLIRPNPMQPRLYFDENELNELASSIAELGVIQPIVVCEVDKGYELIVGERRLRAAKKVGLSTIPAIVTQITPTDQQVLALVENVHRSNLSAIEEAQCLRNILDRTGWNQSVLASRLGCSQSSIANKLRLLKLDEGVQNMIMFGKIGERQARSLVGLASEQQVLLAQQIAEEKLNAKEAEALVRNKKQALRPKDHESVSRKSRSKGLSFTGPEGPTGELLKDLAVLVESNRRKGIPVIWKVKELAQRELIVEITVDLKGHIVPEKDKVHEHGLPE
ncbi:MULTISPECIES: ParB/RepB/Spo0J family partition protein [Aminobacterium]|jgi:ParB family chromosome partitioning protein|nr:ParB/RepB/Spo0J family partition protein [Aminobacterium sp. UBA4834]